MVKTARLCMYCRKQLHWRQRSDALYCSGACRTRAWRGHRQVLPYAPTSREVIEEEFWPEGWPGRLEDYPGWGLEEVTFATAVGCARCRRAADQGLLVTLLLPTGLSITVGFYCGDDCLLDAFI